jgi:hypothetical protein
MFIESILGIVSTVLFGFPPRTFWLPTEDVLVCGSQRGRVEIINKDSNGEKVFAIRLR